MAYILYEISHTQAKVDVAVLACCDVTAYFTLLLNGLLIGEVSVTKLQQITRFFMC
jgi:hypothetical protein